jgi:hypothetical protein
MTVSEQETKIRWMHVDVSPFRSVAIQFTTLVPDETVVPLKSLITLKIPQLSEAVGFPRLPKFATHVAGSALIAKSAGHTIVGLCVSATVTTCVQVAVRPLASLTVQMTVVEPVG